MPQKNQQQYLDVNVSITHIKTICLIKSDTYILENSWVAIFISEPQHNGFQCWQKENRFRFLLSDQFLGTFTTDVCKGCVNSYY